MADPQTDRGPVEDPQTEKGLGPKEAFLAKAVKRFHRAETNEGPNRMMALDDLKFKDGMQWPEDIKAQRTLEKRPCLTINKIKTFVHQITNDQRQNRPAISVSPIGDKADKATAKMLKGLIKQIERQSNADVAYDTGFESAVSMGWGFWRIYPEYEYDGSFDQCLKIERIRNPMRVYMDPDAIMPDGSDAQWCFISDLITREEFDVQWGEAKATPWNEGTVGDEWDKWSNQTHVRIAEYFYIVTTKRELVQLENGHVGYKDELDEELAAIIKERPDFVTRKRDVEERKVKWAKITSHEILEEQTLECKWIPVVRVIGDESDIEGKVNYAGIIRDAKDPQRMYNYWSTSETEMIALAPKAPWVMEEGQLEGHEKRWQQANIKSLPYLLYKGTSIGGKQVPPPGRQTFDGPPQAIVNAKIGAAQDMQAVTGIRFDATMNERMYDESGKALRELKRVGDLGNFHYIDNLARSLRHTGRILVDWIPKIYDTRRVLTILREDDQEEQAIIDPGSPKAYQQRQTEDGKTERLYNPRVGDYEVAVTIGPSYATKRAEAADSMMAFIGAYPPAASVAGDLIAKNMDWPGAEEIAARLETLLPPALQEQMIKDLPDEAKGIVANLMQQTQQMKQQLDQAAAMLGDKEKDRAIDREKIARDYEAKMTDIAAGMQETIIKVIADQQQNQGGQMEKIIGDFEAKMAKIMADKELGERKLENDMLLGIGKMGMDASLQREQMEQGEDEGESRKGGKKSESGGSQGITINLAGGGKKKKGKRKIVPRGDGIFEMIEMTPAEEKVLRRVKKTANGEMEVEDLDGDD